MLLRSIISPIYSLLIIALGGAFVLLPGCSGGESGNEAPPATVRYMTVTEQQVTLTRELPGRVSAFMVSDVRPQVGGIIQERLFDEGAEVEAGQVLYQIDPALFQAAYNNAQAELARVEANEVSARLLAQRYGQIVQSDAVSKQENDDAQAAYRHARASVAAAREALETARINLDYTKVTAPVSGTIGRSFVTPGALVTAHQPQPLATIQQLDHVYVDVTRPSAELLQWKRALEQGQLKSSGPNSVKVKLILEDGTPYARNDAAAAAGEQADWIEGDLLFSDVTIDQSTGVVTVRARFENNNRTLLPGMYVRAVLEEGVLEKAILVPQKVVFRDPRGNPQVRVLTKTNPAPEDKDAKPLGADEYYTAVRPVVIERDVNNNWLISSGLQAGDLVLVDGLQKSRPGEVVLGQEIMSDSSSSLASTQIADRRN